MCINLHGLQYQNTTGRLGGFTSRILILTVLEDGESEIEVPAVSVPGEDSLPGLLTAATFSLCPHGAERNLSVSLPPFTNSPALLD